MRNHITRIDSKEIHRGNLVRLCQDSVILPDGTAAIYEHVEIKHGASTLAMEPNGDVWLVREWKYAIDRPSLEVVSGGVEPGEEPLETARRELREEAGLTAARWTPLGFVDPFTTMLRCPNYMFIAEELSPARRQLDAGEALETVRMPLTEAAARVFSGEITHATSCVLILRAAALKRLGE
ncbi:MAG TPA: NUDIX hydrolase [Bryobacteraceae bacterium]|nr:NUDIX hydrolase [Bryobacteraceae bacterium]